MTTTPSTEPDSFDAFWDEVHGGRRTTLIEGVQVSVPTDLPLGFQERYRELANSSSDDDAVELIEMLFGADAAKQWMAPPKIGQRKLMTVLLWGMAQALGEDVDFAEAYRRVQAGAVEGKAPANRASKRAAQRKPSGSSGGRSKRTSPASTASTRTPSRA